MSDNNPSLGSYYTNPSSVSTTEFSGLWTSAVEEINGGFPADATTTVTGAEATYRAGDAIRAYYASPTAVGIASLPVSAASGVCDYSNPMRYLEDSPVPDGYTCHVPITSMAVECATALNADGAVTNLALAIDPGNAGTPISVGTIRSCPLDTSTGVVGACVGALTAPSWSGTSCDDAVVEVRYYIHHDGAGLLTSWDVDVITVDIDATSMPTTSTFSVPQTYRVTWVSDATPPDDSDVIARPKGGNPGWVLGAPMVVGSLSSVGATDDAILTGQFPTAAGITIGSAGLDGSCTSGAPGVPVLYGMNTVVGCTLDVSVTDINTACAALRTNTESFLTLPAGYTHVPAWASADYHNNAAWVAMDVETIASGSSGGSGGECTEVIVGVNYEFLTAPLGAVGNAQHRIVGVSVSYEKETVRFSCKSGVCTAASAATTQPVELRWSATFAVLADSATEEVYPAPPALPELPSDIFYPFSLGPASPSAAPGALTLTLALIVTFVVSNLL